MWHGLVASQGCVESFVVNLFPHSGGCYVGKVGRSRAKESEGIVQVGLKTYNLRRFKVFDYI